jgi:hypothetical protein
MTRSRPRDPIEISATSAEAFENTKTLRVEGLRFADGVTASDIAGAGFEPATFGAIARLPTQLR